MESRRKRSRSQILKWCCYVPVSYTHLRAHET